MGQQLQAVGIKPGPILIEPEAKDTAAAVLAASLLAYQKDTKSLLLVAPSDHLISDTGAFHDALNVALEYALNGNLVTFGIKSTGAETKSDI